MAKKKENDIDYVLSLIDKINENLSIQLKNSTEISERVTLLSERVDLVGERNDIHVDMVKELDKVVNLIRGRMGI